MLWMLSCFFFFSSRRRHTRYIGDWSSDVCSSDLADDPPVRLELALARAAGPDAATGPRQVRPEAGEPRQLVLELRELHLEATLVRARRSEERRGGKGWRSRGAAGSSKRKESRARE